MHTATFQGTTPMYQNGMNAYKQASRGSMTDREADLTCFKLLRNELQKSMETPDISVRNQAIIKNQRLWSLIQRANAAELGKVDTEDRLLFNRMADSAQRYGIRAMLDQDLTLLPLVEIVNNVIEGLTDKKEENSSQA